MTIDADDHPPPFPRLEPRMPSLRDWLISTGQLIPAPVDPDAPVRVRRVRPAR